MPPFLRLCISKICTPEGVLLSLICEKFNFHGFNGAVSYDLLIMRAFFDFVISRDNIPIHINIRLIAISVHKPVMHCFMLMPT